MTDKTFSREIKEMLEIASNLLKESETEDTKIYVQKTLKDVRQFLQKKQTEGEELLEIQIEKENESVQNLEIRINGLIAGTIEEVDTLDYIQLYQNLKENEWFEAFNALLEIKKLNIENILQQLMEIFKVTYEQCRKPQADHNHELMTEAMWVGVKPKDKRELQGLTDEQIQELRKHATFCQDKTAQYCIQSISKKLLEEVKKEKAIAKKFKNQSERVIAALNAYIIKCIQVSWITQFETPPIHIVIDPKRECPKIMGQFVERKQVPYGKLVEWPALVQGHSLKDGSCTVKVPWQLFEKAQGRPNPCPEKVPTHTPPPQGTARVELQTDQNTAADSERNIQQMDGMSNQDNGYEDRRDAYRTTLDGPMEQNIDVAKLGQHKERGKQRETPGRSDRELQKKPGPNSKPPNLRPGNKNISTKEKNTAYPHARDSTNF